MPEQIDLSHLFIKIDGSNAPPELLRDLVAVTVDHSLHLPSMFILDIYNHDMRWSEETLLREGSKVEIFAGERPPKKLMSGKVATIEPALEQRDPRLIVRGYDLSHQLYRGRHRRAFHKSTDAELARTLAGEAGLQPGTIDDTGEEHEYLFQNNQTNAEFLLERARRLGYEMWVEEDKLHFRKPSPNGQPVQLAWGKELRSFRPRLSTAQQVNEVEVRGWDVVRKTEIVGRATRGEGAPQIGIAESGADIAKRAWGAATVGVVDEHVRSPAEAEKLAQAVLNELTSAFVEAEGTSTGNADIYPGRQVEITGVGTRFNGSYYVTRVEHEWSQADGLDSHFTVSGRRDMGVWSMLEQASARSVGLGMVIGIVTDNRDPEEMGRVKVRYPWLSDDNESAWARIVSPMAGEGRGFFFLPEIDDEVLVGFEHGDIHRPFVMGALWNGKDAPPVPASEAVAGDGQVNQRVIKSRSGHIITLDDTAGAEQITIVDRRDNQIVFRSSENSMEIRVGGDLTIEVGGKIKISGAAGIAMTSDAAVEVEGQRSVTVESSGPMTLNSAGAAVLESKAALNLKASGRASLESSAGTDVKGPVVSVDGQAAVNVKGGVIKLN